MCWANPIAIVIVPVTLKVKYALGRCGGGGGALCLGPKDLWQRSVLRRLTLATDRGLIVPQHFLKEEFLFQEI